MHDGPNQGGPGQVRCEARCLGCPHQAEAQEDLCVAEQCSVDTDYVSEQHLFAIHASTSW